MLELTNEQCNELNQRVVKKLSEMFRDDDTHVQEAIARMAVPAVILTIREYEAMTAPDSSTSPQSAE